MSPQEFELALSKTLDDGRFSRSERQALSAVLGEMKLPMQQIDAYRSIAFKLARKAMKDTLTPANVLDWLESVLKLFRPADGKDRGAGRSEAYFSPGEECRRRIASLFQHARRSADVCVFTITDNQITDQILAAHRRGLAVRIITDDDKSFDRGSDIDRLDRAGITVRVDRTPHHMHHKFAIFDGKTLLTGSYNWTVSAARHNEENFVVTDDGALVGQFQSVFGQLWDQFS